MKLDKFPPIMGNVIRNRNLFLIEMRIIDAQPPKEVPKLFPTESHTPRNHDINIIIQFVASTEVKLIMKVPALLHLTLGLWNV